MVREIAELARAAAALRLDEDPWKVAVDRFRMDYKVSGGRWTRRAPQREEPDAMKDLIELYERALAEADGDLDEAKTKAVSGRRHQRGDFLVQGEDDKPTTWHLPVRVNGKPNRRLAGAAWAALLNPAGYRGNRYEGPDAAKARKALRALYKAEGWETPTSEAAARLGEGGWYPSDSADWPSVPWGARSFADIEVAHQTQEATEKLHALTYQFGQLASNILGASEDEAADRIEALRSLTAEYLGMVESTLGLVSETEASEGAPPTVQIEEGAASAETALAETFAGALVSIAEAAEDGAPQDAVPMTVDVALIEPGFGNDRDRNFYPKEMIRRDAGVLVNAKMYETDHRPSEKSTRTWVSTIKSIKGFTESGAPIGEVVVHDEGFAKRIRALKAAGMLERMESSILGKGLARKGKVDGRDANVIESITEIQAVDWVTRAGAGGRALSISESEGGTMKIATVKIKGIPAGMEVTDDLRKRLGEAFGELAEIEEVVLAEATEGEPEADPEPAPEAAPEAETPPEAPPTPEALKAEEVEEILKGARLPEPVKARLAEGSYATADALRDAVRKELDYIKAATGSGRVFGLGESAAAGDPTPMSQEEVDKQYHQIAERYGLA